MPKPTRAYLKMQEGEFRPLLWAQNNKPNEMLLGIYGLSAATSILRSAWPEQVVGKSDLPTIRYDYNDAVHVGIAFDHVTCHADGRFHLKMKDNSTVYSHAMQRVQALGPDTSTFLEVFVVSDIASRYAVSRKTKYPHIWFGISEHQYIALRGMFSGINFPVEQQMISTMSQFQRHSGGVVLTSGTLKGVFIGGPSTISDQAQAGRPSGTILSFKFPVDAEHWHIKTFLFE